MTWVFSTQPKFWKFGFLLFAVGGLIFNSEKSFSEDVFIIKRSEDESKHIQGLKVETVAEVEANGVPSRKFFFIIKGTFERMGWSLASSGGLSETDRMNGRAQFSSTKEHPIVKFSFRIPMIAKALKTSILAIGPLGQFEKETLIIYKKAEAPPPKPKKTSTSFTMGLGLTSATYSETGARETNASFILLTALGGMRIPFGESRFSFAPGFYLTALTLKKTGTESNVRFLGLNLRLAYSTPLFSSPLSLDLLGGFYYTTMFVDQQNLGYTNLLGLQIYPTLRYKLNPSNSIGIYLKYAPLLGTAQLDPSSQREIATGLSWLHSLGRESNKDLLISLDYSNFKFGIETTQINNSTVSLSGGLVFR